jgi:hypothetical protein
MSTVDVNRVIVTGENSAIRLSPTDSDSFTTNASFWRILSSAAGSGHVLYLNSELTGGRWRIYADNIAVARWLQSTVIGAIYTELRDPNIAVIDAQFSKSGDVRDFWTERLDARDEQILMTWYRMGEPFLEHDSVWRNRQRGFPKVGVSDSRCWLGWGPASNGETLFTGFAGAGCGVGVGRAFVSRDGGDLRGERGLCGEVVSALSGERQRGGLPDGWTSAAFVDRRAGLVIGAHCREARSHLAGGGG